MLSANDPIMIRNSDIRRQTEALTQQHAWPLHDPVISQALGAVRKLSGPHRPTKQIAISLTSWCAVSALLSLKAGDIGQAHDGHPVAVLGAMRVKHQHLHTSAQTQLLNNI
jgi:hypothetical protein